MDHNTRTVLSGSALGKEYAARAWEEWFKDPQPQTEEPGQSYEPIPMQEQQPELSAPQSGDSDPTLLEQMMLDGLDAFGALFEAEQPPYEYIDPAFRLIRKKKKKKFRRKL